MNPDLFFLAVSICMAQYKDQHKYNRSSSLQQDVAPHRRLPVLLVFLCPGNARMLVWPLVPSLAAAIQAAQVVRNTLLWVNTEE